MLTIVVTLAQVLLAYLLVDAFSGLYHWATDSGFNVRQQRESFADHHVTNTMQEPISWLQAAVGVPVGILGLLCDSAFLGALGVFTVLVQVPHYYAHRRSESPIVHHVVRALQLSGLIISPEKHAAHHNGVFDRNFCIVSGWNNVWLNPLTKLPAAIGAASMATAAWCVTAYGWLLTGRWDDQW